MTEIQMPPGSTFRINGESYEIVGTAEGKAVGRILGENPNPNEALHRLFDPKEIETEGSDFWITSGELSKEKLAKQYNDMIGVLIETRVITYLSAGEKGIVGIDGDEYPVPTLDDIIKEMLKKAELFSQKISQGFNQLLLTPFGYRIDTLMDRFVSLNNRSPHLTKMIVDQSMTEEFLEPNGLLLYFLENDIQNNDPGSRGKTKSEILEKPNIFPGWQVSLVMDITETPSIHVFSLFDNSNISGRPDIPSNKTISFLDYLQLLSSDPIYIGESGFCPEEWITLAMYNIRSKGRIIDQHSNHGRIMLGSDAKNLIPSIQIEDFLIDQGRSKKYKVRVSPKYALSSHVGGAVRTAVRLN